jgi:hypothetical protein
MLFGGRLHLVPDQRHLGLIAGSIHRTLVQTLRLSFSQVFFSLVREIIVSVEGEENVTLREDKY